MWKMGAEEISSIIIIIITISIIKTIRSRVPWQYLQKAEELTILQLKHELGN